MEATKRDMVYYYPNGHQAHFEPGHPESPERVERLRSALQEAGWWNEFPCLDPKPLADDFLGSVHAPEYLKVLKSASQHGQHLDMDTYTTSASWELALATAGGAVATAQAVWQGEAQCGFALTRPPGHHASALRGMGFCLLNNIAISADYLVQAGGAQRLAIVDLDLHHGNGTQDIFWQRGDVFYFSIHQSPLYPGTGRMDETGAGAGEGRTANFPLPPGSGDMAYQEIMQEILLPLLDRFEPEMILVSFGFDPHWLDPLGHLQLSAAGYRKLIIHLVDWTESHCQGKICLFLEGGYDLDAAAACGQAVVSALLKRDWTDPLGPSPRPEGRSWQAVVAKAKQVWG